MQLGNVESIIKAIGGGADELLTSLDEDNQAMTMRQKMDMLSDSWLSKNIRPLITLMDNLAVYGVLVVSIFFDVDIPSELFWFVGSLVMSTRAFYFGSRGLEKISKTKFQPEKPNRSAVLRQMRKLKKQGVDDDTLRDILINLNLD